MTRESAFPIQPFPFLKFPRIFKIPQKLSSYWNYKKKFLTPARATIEQASQHPDSLQYIQQLEDYSKYQRQESVEEISPQRPAFIRPLQDLGELQEGRNAHFEAQLTPVSDPTMKVEWYKDGRPITASEYNTNIFTLFIRVIKLRLHVSLNIFFFLVFQNNSVY